ncbi:hypothetical protein TrVE_jg1993 [Triparma verrucosa]|uniref:Phytanoyl-CoA dioxygenase n=1 Tax=Triparma verrucosa TaxID=1606542 RepID=A0A9W7BQ16_9STRA|nr:hypothetical protein TrVE_jg1993 [Triparma verrucosa]
MPGIIAKKIEKKGITPELMTDACVFVATAITHYLLLIVKRRRRAWHSKLRPIYVPKSKQRHFTMADVDFEGQSIRSHFDEHGWVVVSGVLDDIEVSQAMSYVWDYLETASRASLSHASTSRKPVSRGDPSTWASEGWPATVEGGILPYFSSGQSSAAWSIRSNEKVKRIFRRFWGTENVLTSFDGLLVWRRSVKTECGWFHIDQNPVEKPGFETVQGLVNLVDGGVTTGGNVLISTSHKDFPQHYRENPLYASRLADLNGDDWLEVVSADPILSRYEAEEKIVRLELERGDVLLWDSRVVHCSNSSETDEEEVDRIERAAVLVSMMPEDQVSENCRKVRRAAVDAGRTGSHWVDKVAVLGAEREEEAALERARYEGMKRLDEGRGAILGYGDMTEAMRELI